MPEPKLELVITGITDPSKLACIARARTYKQYVRMVEDAHANRCPFCQIDREHNKIIAENTDWFCWPCNPPEKYTRFHFLFVPKRHVKSIEELSLQEVTNLFYLRSWTQRSYEYKSSGLLIRDDDATLSAGTIEHLHVHVMVPDGTGRVETPFYKGREAEEAGLRRALVYEKMRTKSLESGLTDPFLLASNLSEEDYLLIAGRLE